MNECTSVAADSVSSERRDPWSWSRCETSQLKLGRPVGYVTTLYSRQCPLAVCILMGESANHSSCNSSTYTYREATTRNVIKHTYLLGMLDYSLTILSTNWQFERSLILQCMPGVTTRPSMYCIHSLRSIHISVRRVDIHRSAGRPTWTGPP